MKNNLILIGCGHHYRGKYHSVLEENRVKIALLIDLESNRETIQKFFLDKSIKPAQMVFLDERFHNDITPNDIDKLISPLIDRSIINGVMISSDPQVRKPYVLWAAKLGLPIFMDKPISAFSKISDMDKLFRDFQEIEALQSKEIVVSCERRAHVGYQWLENEIKSTIRETQVPITAIDIHFAGGVWNFPNELPNLKHHPFKYGFGILLHSGYHYVDLLASFLSFNEAIAKFDDLTFDIQCMITRPGNQIPILGQAYSSLFKSDQAFQKDTKNSLEHFGEVDILLIGQAKLDDVILTNFSLKLFGTSLSLRKKVVRPSNLEGRVRQEHLILHLGHVCSVHLGSYPLKKLNPTESVEHFAITIMNNPLLIGRNPIVTMDRSQISDLHPEIAKTASLNSYARQWQLKEFLHGRDGHSSFSSHRNTMKLLDLIYSQIYGALTK